MCSQTVVCDGRLNPKLFVMLASIEYNMLGKIMNKRNYSSPEAEVSSLASCQSDKETATVVQRKIKVKDLYLKHEGGTLGDHVSLNCLVINLIGKQKKSEANSQTSVCQCAQVQEIKEYSWKGCKKPVYTHKHCFSVFKTETKFIFNNYQILIARVKVLFIIIF